MNKKKRKPIQELFLDALNKEFVPHLDCTVFFIYSSDIITSQGTRDAINNFDDYNRNSIKATYWFDKFWFYIEIKFLCDEDINRLPFVSISFFEEKNGNLNQLFRTEWDNYKPHTLHTLTEKYNHPQPHWHFTFQLNAEQSFEDLRKDDDLGIYAELIKDNTNFDIHKMHIAMGGDWINSGEMMTPYNNEKTIVKWMIYLFRHIKEELQYKIRS